MSELRSFIEECLLQEDLQGFMKDSKDIIYVSSENPDPETVKQSRSVKRLWSKHADHSFMDSLVKIHWFSWSRARLPEDFRWFLDNPGKDEISTQAYLPGRNLQSSWGGVGIEVKGRVTLAANDMNAIVSGFGKNLSSSGKHASSGVPKRAAVFFGAGSSASYVLDADSFDASSDEGNEFIVGNWHVKSLVIADFTYAQEGLPETIKLAREKGIPLIDANGKNIDYALALSKIL